MVFHHAKDRRERVADERGSMNKKTGKKLAKKEKKTPAAPPPVEAKKAPEGIQVQPDAQSAPVAFPVSSLPLDNASLITVEKVIRDCVGVLFEATRQGDSIAELAVLSILRTKSYVDETCERVPNDEKAQSAFEAISRLNAEMAKATERSNRILHDAYLNEELRKLTLLPPPDYKLPVPPPPEEWDFRSCPEEERDMCLEYELSREVPLWRTMVHNYRLVDEGKNPTAVLNLIMTFPHLVSLVSFPEWPKKPWLALSQRSIQKSLWEDWSSLFADCDSLAEDAPLA